MQSLIERYGKSLAVAFGMGLLLALLVLPTVSAQSNKVKAHENRTAAQERLAEKVATRELRAAQREAAQADKLAAREAKLEEKKLALCQKREEKVQNIMARITDRGTRHLEVFNKISDRVQAFYEDKGLSAANYDELVAAVEEKKLAAEGAIAGISEVSTDFDCEGGNPLGVKDAFKAHLKVQITALKDYRTAIKDLIVGTRGAAEKAGLIEPVESEDGTEGEDGTDGTDDTEGTEDETDTDNSEETEGEEGGEQ